MALIHLKIIVSLQFYSMEEKCRLFLALFVSIRRIVYLVIQNG